ncbi:MAG: hypothetical protein JRG76_18820 [Deltaproteobacteria bacterium]|nr:hypothetical protein [Deltaproteobacteria bacterium]MBW2416554.1 hypothetical protein [Deltaproteobacteria bacterium]
MRLPSAPFSAPVVLLHVAALAAVLGAAPPVQAQKVGGQTPQVSTRELAMNYIVGRYVSPVTCTREDGSLLQTHQSMTIRKDRSRGLTTTGAHVVRATLFGIDVSGVQYCHNLMQRRLADTRGVFFITYRGQTREDLGLSDFRRELRDGEISYHVRDGRITSRGVGEAAGETSTRDLTGADAVLHLRQLPSRSDGDRMLERWAKETGFNRRALRLELELEIPDGDSVKVWVLKETGKKRSGSRR